MKTIDLYKLHVKLIDTRKVYKIESIDYQLSQRPQCRGSRQYRRQAN